MARDVGAAIRAKQKKFGSRNAMILLGDFNDEPYDEVLKSLPSTRDRGLAVDHESFFYNPFWNHIGECSDFTLSNRKNSLCGTYFYRQGGNSRWSTFDQILFSSSFLGKSIWVLNEQRTRVVYNDLILDEQKNNSFIFDHFPVVGAFERK